jgi:hypothetical protein
MLCRKYFIYVQYVCTNCTYCKVVCLIERFHIDKTSEASGVATDAVAVTIEKQFELLLLEHI